MTAKERTALQNLFNKIEEVRNQQDKYFKELQDLARENKLTVSCSVDYNMEQLVKLDLSVKTDWGCPVANRARHLYEEYMVLEGKYQQLMELGEVLAEVGFWK